MNEDHDIPQNAQNKPPTTEEMFEIVHDDERETEAIVAAFGPLTPFEMALAKVENLTPDIPDLGSQLSLRLSNEAIYLDNHDLMAVVEVISAKFKLREEQIERIDFSLRCRRVNYYRMVRWMETGIYRFIDVYDPIFDTKNFCE